MSASDPQPDPDHSARARAVLESASSALILGHVRPDGDVLGSQVGLSWALAESGRSVRVMNPDLPESRFDHLRPASPFEAYAGELPDHDVAILVDGNTLTRAEDLGAAIRDHGAPVLVIDHHIPSCDPWWDGAWLDPTASSTGLMVLRLIRELGLGLRPEQAQGLFVAMASDTGWFRHANTDAETLAAAADLVRAGARPDALHRALFRRRGRDFPAHLARVLGGLQELHGGRVGYLEVPFDVDLDPNAPDTAMELARAVEGRDVVVLLREMADGRVRMSLRGEGEIDVHAVALSLGGGGHRRAAGAVFDGPLPSVRERVLERVSRSFGDDLREVVA